MQQLHDPLHEPPASHGALTQVSPMQAEHGHRCRHGPGGTFPVTRLLRSPCRRITHVQWKVLLTIHLHHQLAGPEHSNVHTPMPVGDGVALPHPLAGLQPTIHQPHELALQLAADGLQPQPTQVLILSTQLANKLLWLTHILWCAKLQVVAPDHVTQPTPAALLAPREAQLLRTVRLADRHAPLRPT